MMMILGWGGKWAAAYMHGFKKRLATHFTLSQKYFWVNILCTVHTVFLCKSK